MTPIPEMPPIVLHRSALLAAGLTIDEIRSSRSSGKWHTLHRGAYCDAASVSTMTIEQMHRLRAQAVAARSPHLVLSHISAATMLRLPMWGAALDKVHLTRIGNSGGRTGPGRVVHTADLGPGEFSVRSGTRMTTVARTLIDIACSTGFSTAVIAADAAIHREAVSVSELADALAKTQHRRGAAAARRALWFANGRSESVGESRTRIAMHQFGLPAPVLQVRIYAPDGTFLGRADLGYPELGVLFEFDGLVKYRKPFRPEQNAEDVVINEKLREDLIRDMGYVVVRFVWAELANPTAMLAKINAALVRGRRVVANGGLTGTWAADPPLVIPR